MAARLTVGIIGLAVGDQQHRRCSVAGESEITGDGGGGDDRPFRQVDQRGFKTA